ncbi:Soluble lytic transglycosylase, TAT-containing [Aromatoleum bremense]|nr:Soluble lytic transglycosylase, TAT-containing [Aromatoleum bremense]
MQNSRRTFLGTATSALVLLAAPALSYGRSDDNGQRRTYPPIPPAYGQVARSLGLPATILYGVAIQESVMVWKTVALPWPWTLNVRAVPRRYASYAEAVTDLRQVLAQGVRNVDCGTMQVNWRYHSDRLRTPTLALDPWHNLTVAASILLERRAAATNWFDAVGAYHVQDDEGRATRYARSVFAHIARIEHV